MKIPSLLIMVCIANALIAKTYLVDEVLDNKIGSLRVVIDSANNNPGADTILFSNSIDGDTLFLSEGFAIDIDDTLFILGNGPTNTMIHGEESTQVFSVLSNAYVELNAVCLIKGSGSFGGGAEVFGVLIMNDCLIKENEASIDGGGIYCHTGGELICEGSMFWENIAPSGGGIAIDIGGKAMLAQCEFKENGSVTTDGGGLTNNADSTRISNCRFTRNIGSRGGAILNRHGKTLFISETRIDSNTTLENGGGIYNFPHGKVYLKNNKIQSNEGIMGGGIFNDILASVHSEKDTFELNNANGSGGGIYNLGSAEILYTRITSCSAPSGGGIMNTSGAALFLRNSRLSGLSNSALINIDGSEADIYQCIISGNNSSSSGGAIYNGENSFLLIAQSTITGNSTGQDGGGIYNQSLDYALLELNNTIITANIALFGTNDLVNEDSSFPVLGGHNLIGDGAGQESFIDGVNGNIVGTDITPADPIFISNVDPSDSLSGDFRLQACSPAINAGDISVVSSPDSFDLYGQQRISADTLDMGVFEFPEIYPSDPLFYQVCPMPEPCPDTLIINQPYIFGVYKAAQLIIIEEGTSLMADVELRAREVLIHPNFEAPLGIRFETINTPCSN